MVDIYFLSKASEEWRNEVMRHTGNAGLSISGSLHAILDGQLSPKEQFLARLLETEWHRVVKIRLYIRNSQQNMHLDILHIFWTKPAPSLREFGVKAVDGDGGVSLPPGAALFNNNAPHLRSFRWHGLNFDLRAAWIGQLSQLYLPKTCTVQLALDVLRECPHLYRLTYDSDIPFLDGLPTSKKVDLPELRHLTITADLGACFAFLTHITPNPSCVLKMNTRDSPAITARPAKQMTTLVPILSRYLKAALDYPARQYKLKFVLREREPYYALSLEGPKLAVVTTLNFDGVRSTEIQASIPELFLDALSACKLHSVVTLYCTSDFVHAINARIIEILFPNFKNLRRLVISDAFLEIIATDNTFFLPFSLNKIKMMYSRYRLRTFDRRRHLMLSLLGRTNHAMELDISQHCYHDWRVLDEIPGLKVVWVPKEIKREWKRNVEKEKKNINSSDISESQWETESKKIE
ncbi:hypothetical protein D9613_003578 [Agrocybe pediades]|uniref:F-box domain-containing protein n=1 Tax=Agrocybe pediades TaxID=84607 RepID=A0A8H4QJ57_9AGAR|nr:hypothetical protein D9613_003578 [Agrocybe pediades]